MLRPPHPEQLRSPLGSQMLSHKVVFQHEPFGGPIPKHASPSDDMANFQLVSAERTLCRDRVARLKPQLFGSRVQPENSRHARP